MLSVLAVTLPDHVNAACRAAQDELFGRYGLVSTRALPPLIPLLWLSRTADDYGRRSGERLRRRPPGLNRIFPTDALEQFSLQPFTLAAVRGDVAYAAPVIPASSMALIRDRLSPFLPGRQTDLPGAASNVADAALPAPVDMLFLGLREHALLPEAPFGARPLWDRPIGTATLELIEIELEMATGADAAANGSVCEAGTCIERIAWRSVAEHKLTAAR